MNKLNFSRISNATYQSQNVGMSVYKKILIDHQKYKNKMVDENILKN
jgi:hypothetical protein